MRALQRKALTTASLAVWLAQVPCALANDDETNAQLIEAAIAAAPRPASPAERDAALRQASVARRELRARLRTANDSVRTEIQALLRDRLGQQTDPDCVRNIASLLATEPDPASVQALLAELNRDHRDAVKAAMCRSIEKCVARLGALEREAISDVCIGVLSDIISVATSDYALSQQAVCALGAFGPEGFDAISGLCEDPKVLQKLRDILPAALANTGDVRAIPKIVELGGRADSHRSHQVACCVGLGSLFYRLDAAGVIVPADHRKLAVNFVSARAQQQDDEQMAAGAIVPMSRLVNVADDAAFRAIVIRSLNAQNERLRAAALRVLYRSEAARFPEIAPLVTRATQDTSDRVRRLAAAVTAEGD